MHSRAAAVSVRRSRSYRPDPDAATALPARTWSSRFQIFHANLPVSVSVVVACGVIA